VEKSSKKRMVEQLLHSAAWKSLLPVTIAVPCIDRSKSLIRMSLRQIERKIHDSKNMYVSAKLYYIPKGLDMDKGKLIC
jgi:hypothetical protein